MPEYWIEPVCKQGPWGEFVQPSDAWTFLSPRGTSRDDLCTAAKWSWLPERKNANPCVGVGLWRICSIRAWQTKGSKRVAIARSTLDPIPLSMKDMHQQCTLYKTVGVGWL